MFTAEHRVAPYKEFELSSTYDIDQGVVALPIAGAVGTDGKLACSIITLHAPVGIRTVTWTATRRGVPPQVPSTTAPDSNHVLQSVRIENPVVSADEDDGTTPVFSISGEYVYLLRKPILTTDGMPAGATPVLAAPIEAHTAQSREFTDALLVTTATPITSPTQFGGTTDLFIDGQKVPGR